MPRIVITGGNRGIGLELARLFAASGNEVVIGVRDPVAASHLPFTVHPLDVGDDESVHSLAELLKGQPVDILVNNAGVIGPEQQSSRHMNFAGFLDALNVNTLGPLRVTQALLENLCLARSAKVIIVSSRMGSLSYAKSDRIAYRASKAAVNKVTQCLATDLAEDGIAVGAVHPGWVRTDMGGALADISPQESAGGIISVIENICLNTTGRFWSYDGSNISW